MKNILFFLVHPAKFHFHKVQINKLIVNGNKVDILITTKDVLEELVIEEVGIILIYSRWKKAKVL